MGLTVPGIDYAWGHKPYDTFKARGFKFAMRYISHDPGKDLSADEVRELWKRGIKVGVVFESTAGRALGGQSAGAFDAHFADKRVKDLGLAGIPVYFAVDFDASDAQKPGIAKYLQGAVSVLGTARVGVYGGYWVVKYMAEHKACAWFWQTYAWSGGHVHPQAHIYQHENGVSVAGLSCDLNRGRDDIGFGVRGPTSTPAPKPATRQARKRKVWRGHLVQTNKQLAALRKRAQKLGRLLGRKPR